MRNEWPNERAKRRANQMMQGCKAARCDHQVWPYRVSLGVHLVYLGVLSLAVPRFSDPTAADAPFAPGAGQSVALQCPCSFKALVEGARDGF